MSLFEVPFEKISKKEIEVLLEKQWHETTEVEFKREIPKKGILPTLVAFANSHGGWLILGIDEGESDSDRASKLLPISNCETESSRIEDQIRDCIDPPLPFYNCKGIPMKKDGSGVIIFYIPQSRIRPHQVYKSNGGRSYIRTANSTKEIKMREIQDLTLQAVHQFDQVERLFEEKRKNFTKWAAQPLVIRNGNNQLEKQPPALKIRITALPLSVGNLGVRVIDHPEIDLRIKPFQVKIGETTRVIDFPNVQSSGRSVLRGKRFESNILDFDEFYFEVNNNGPIEVGWKLPHSRVVSQNSEVKNGEVRLREVWILGLFFNVLRQIEKFREVAKIQEMEFGLEVEITSFKNYFYFLPRFADHLVAKSYLCENWKPPRYLAGKKETFQDLISLFHEDIYDTAGLGQAPDLKIDLNELLS